HARHRPRTDQDPAHVTPPTSFGWIYPEGDIVAVVHDRTSGERTLLALYEAGVPRDDMDLVDPQWFLAAEHAAEQHRGFLQRLGAWLAGEEAQLIEGYKAEARRGHPILVVHAGDRARVELVRRVLSEHGARRIEYYERFVIEDL